MAAFVPLDTLEFGGELQVEPSAYHPYVSRSFGGTLHVTGWGDWSPWWMGTITNISAPSSFTASGYSESIINLTWTKAESADRTYIRMKKGSAPTTRNDGAFVCNTTAAYYDVTSLDIGTNYSFSAWSYDDVYKFSIYNSTYGYTFPGTPSNFIMTSNTSASITYSWTKGTNSTNTTIRYSAVETPEDPNTANNGYNDTASSGTISGLTTDTTYYASAWGYDPVNDYFSDNFVSLTANTSFVPTNVTGLTAVSTNSSQINLSWTKGSGSYTIVVRKATGYPSNYNDGTEAYNGTASTATDTGLDASTLYYYGAWSWTGGHYSLGSAQASGATIPTTPTNITTDYIGTGNTLFINWTIPADSDATLVVKNTSHYPYNNSNDLIQNNTNATYNESSLTDFAYYNLYTYNDTTGYYSRPKHVTWGAMAIDAFNESSGLAIGFNLFISDSLGSETFEEQDLTNTYYLSLEDIPYGVQTVIQVSNTSYETRVTYRDLYINNFYDYNYYLPIAMPPGGTEDPGYDENETYAALYLVSVVNQFDTPVENATIEFRKYIGVTEEYQTVSILITDAMGQASLYLIPETEYKVFISASGYEDEVASYIPESAIFTHTFRVKLIQPTEEEEIRFIDIIEWDAYFNTGDNSTLYIEFNDLNENVSSARLRIFQNDSVLMGTRNFTTDIYFWNWTGANHSLHNYLIRLDLFNHTNLGNMSNTITIPWWQDSNFVFITDLELNIAEELGSAGLIGWLNVFIFGIGVFILAGFGKYWAGLSLILLGAILGIIELAIGLPGFTVQQIGAIAFMIILGALVEIRKAKMEGKF